MFKTIFVYIAVAVAAFVVAVTLTNSSASQSNKNAVSRFSHPPVPIDQGVPDYRSVRALLVGDSLATGMRPTIHWKMGTNRATYVRAKAGKPTAWIFPRLHKLIARTKPHSILVSFGTNDGSDPDKFRKTIRRFMKYVPGNTCVVWSTIYRPARKGPYQAMNTVLRQEAKHYKRLTTIDWVSAVKGGKVNLPDGLHPDTDGFEYRSERFAVRALSGCHN